MLKALSAATTSILILQSGKMYAASAWLYLPLVAPTYISDDCFRSSSIGKSI